MEDNHSSEIPNSHEDDKEVIEHWKSNYICY